MMKVKFANGRELEYTEARDEPIFFDGASRRALTIYFDADKTFLDAIDELASAKENLKTMVFTNDDNPTQVITNLYENYIYKLKVSKEPVVSGEDRETLQPIMVEKVILQLGRATPTELMLEKLMASKA